MPEQSEFKINIFHNGEEYALSARLVTMGYTYKIYVDVTENTTVIFEPDEERNLRAVVDQSQVGKTITHKLVKVIALELEKNLK